MSTSRREFLQKSVIAAAGLGLSTLSPQFIIPRAKEKLGVALAGLG